MSDRRLARLAAALLLSAAGATGAMAQSSGSSTDSTDAAKPAEAAEAAKPTAPAALDTVVATVNGQEVTLGEVIMVRSGLPDKYQSVPDPQLYDAIVEQLINRALLAQHADSKGYGDSAVAKLRAKFDRHDFLANLEIQDVVKAATTEEKLKAEYQKRYVDAEPVTEIRASHILVADKKLADEIHQKLVDGADFAELAKEYGTDGTKDRGGDLGYFVQGDMVQPFSDAAFALEVGQISEPIQTQFGWHVIKLVDKRPRPAPDFESVKAKLSQELATEAVKSSMDGLRADAEIVKPELQPDPAAIRRDDLLDPK